MSNGLSEKVMEDMILLFRLLPRFRSREGGVRAFIADPMFMMLCMLKTKELPVSTIARKLGRSKPNMTQIIDHAINEGFVERKSDKSDRRITIIGITKKGKNYLDLSKSQIRGIVKLNLISLKRPDLERLSVALKGVTEILSKLKED